MRILSSSSASFARRISGDASDLIAAGMALHEKGQQLGPNSLVRACEPDAFREILRAKEALQDDRRLAGGTNIHRQ
jgi:hypothetical protein